MAVIYVIHYLYVLVFCRILGSCTDLMQGIQALILASKDLQKEIVESGTVSKSIAFDVFA